MALTGRILKRRLLLRADSLGYRATGVKPAATRRVDGARHIAREDDALAVHGWVSNRGSREERGGVGVQWHVIEFTRGCHFHDFAPS